MFRSFSAVPGATNIHPKRTGRLQLGTPSGDHIPFKMSAFKMFADGLRPAFLSIRPLCQ
jgi:hypothetical protein